MLHSPKKRFESVKRSLIYLLNYVIALAQTLIEHIFSDITQSICSRGN